MIDRFIWGAVSRISPEAPVPVVRVDRESSSLGGAGNVAQNIAALGGRAVLVGVRGDDTDGEAMARHCVTAGIPTEGLVLAAGRPTTVKTRVVAHHQHVVRFDREDDGNLDQRTEKALIDRALSSLGSSEALIVSDYDKGGVSEGLLAALLPAAHARGIPIVVDPKVRLFQMYRPSTVVTPNTREALEAAGPATRGGTDIEAAGRKLLGLLGCPYLLITRGEKGMLLMREGGAALTIPTVAREVFDVTGAGDTVAATLGLALACGASVEEGAILANQAAGIVVGKVGTASVSRAELLQALLDSAGRQA